MLFVGAGASLDPPSSLPNFVELTRAILQEAGAHELLEALEAFEEGRPTEPPDTLLGRLARQGVDVNRNVVSHLTAPDSKPNDLHRAVVDLALSGRCVRVVC